MNADTHRNLLQYKSGTCSQIRGPCRRDYRCRESYRGRHSYITGRPHHAGFILYTRNPTGDSHYSRNGTRSRRDSRVRRLATGKRHHYTNRAFGLPSSRRVHRTMRHLRGVQGRVKR